jgi:hypothetical protein
LESSVAKRLGISVSPPAERFFVRLEDRFSASHRFTTKDASEGETVSERSVRDWLHELNAAGFLELLKAGRGGKTSLWMIVAGKRHCAGVLPDPELFKNPITLTRKVP